MPLPTRMSFFSFLLFLLSHLLQSVACLPPGASSGCTNYDQPPLKPGSPSQRFTFQSEDGGGERQFLLHVPKHYRHGVPVPLILAFHGEGQSPEEFERQTGLSDQAFNREAVVVYMVGVNTPKSTWTGHPRAALTTQINDPLTIPTLLDHLEASLCILTSRIHAYGFSAGGALVDLLACTPQISRRIASFAATSPSIYVDAALQEPLFSTCPSGGRAMPMLWFFGTADPVVDFGGKGSKAGETWPVERRMKGWAGRNGCVVDKVVKGEVYECKVERWAWSSALYGDDVVQLYLVKGWGHGVGATWPLENDYERFGPTPFNASTIVVDFFRRWPAGARRESQQTKGVAHDEL